MSTDKNKKETTMSDASSGSDVAQFEDDLKQVTIATWNRVRSSDELTSFVDRHHAALTEIEL